MQLVRRLILFAAGVTPLVLLSPQASAQDQFQQSPISQRTYTFVRIQDRDTPGTIATAARAINRRNQIAGTLQCFSGCAYLWQAGDLDIIPPILDDPFAANAAYGLNDRGDVVGQTSVAATLPPHAFLFRSGESTDLGTGYPTPGGYSLAFDINNFGWIIGVRGVSQSAPQRAFLYRDGSFVELGTLGGQSHLPFGVDATANAVNDRGQIVGAALPAQPPLQSYLWEQGVMTALPNLGGNTEASEAFSISNSGHVVGASQTAGLEIHAFSWESGVIRDLGTLGGRFSYAYGVNGLAQVVGSSATATTPTGNAGHATLWEDGQVIDLNRRVVNLPSDVVLETAYAINHAGIIVGNTCTQFCERGPDGNTQAFLLIPSRVQ